MEKIVVLTGHSGGDERLIECLRILFPDCEIQTQRMQTGKAGDVPATALIAAKNTGPKSGIAVRLS